MEQIVFNDKIINTFLIFYIFCFAGWIWESSYVSIKEKRIVNRGFLNGPYIPIYGFGGISVYLVFQKYATTLLDVQSIRIYFYGLLFATLIEYLTSFLMEKIFKARWWDYTNQPFNINGRVCIGASLFWGFLSVVFVQCINPIIENHITLFSHDIRLTIVITMSTQIFIDLLITTSAVIILQNKITMVIKYETEKMEEFKEKINTLPEFPEEYKKLLTDYKTKAYSITNPIVKRLMGTFPKLKFESDLRQKAFYKLEEIKNKKSKK